MPISLQYSGIRSLLINIVHVLKTPVPTANCLTHFERLLWKGRVLLLCLNWEENRYDWEAHSFSVSVPMLTEIVDTPILTSIALIKESIYLAMEIT